MFGVELVAPVLKNHAGMLDAPELVHVKPLVTKPSVERVCEAVLPEFARLDVVCRRPFGFKPLGQFEGDELWPVVKYGSMEKGRGVNLRHGSRCD